MNSFEGVSHANYETSQTACEAVLLASTGFQAKQGLDFWTMLGKGTIRDL